MRVRTRVHLRLCNLAVTNMNHRKANSRRFERQDELLAPDTCRGGGQVGVLGMATPDLVGAARGATGTCSGYQGEEAFARVIELARGSTASSRAAQKPEWS